ncbi:hypothetical protein BOTNAR_0359g00110 [Botryotinia narcissicola]|uniref:Uncharacterized protein n=1 Tax=Botryotinia narcissicola TaxID=278944 RepID=A0A4Z1HRB6_9HELO|nr:hypothetical protein BOTNAR_0359g00110 [Botryotinia narcissicola]
MFTAASCNIQSDVLHHSKLNGKIAIYPGNDYDDLADFLQQLPSYENSPHESRSSEPFLITYNLEMPGAPFTAFECNTQGIERFKKHEQKSTQKARIVFLRGFPDADWLRAVFMVYGVDPAFYQRHLLFPVGNGMNVHSTPLLPSYMKNIFRLNITSICELERKISSTPEDIEDLRAAAATELRRYHISLKSNALIGDSVVRNFSILSRRFSVIEQTISICINKTADSWNAMIWMDNARDLSNSIPGPWCPEDNTNPWETYMLPILQHRDYLSLCNDRSQEAIPPALIQPWEANQNACLLPFQYGRFLDKEILYHDALYAISDVFRLSAASEAKFLNIINDVINHELEVSKNLNKASMVNLQYLRRLIDNHIDGIKETVLVLSSQDQFAWPRAGPGTNQHGVADGMRGLLLNDFLHLSQRAELLSKGCQKGMQSLVNTAAFQEAAKGVANAQRVEQLTLLATIFVPLTFTCSIFGMNFAVFGQGELQLWIFAPVAAGVVALSYALWYVAGYNSRRRSASNLGNQVNN